MNRSAIVDLEFSVPVGGKTAAKKISLSVAIVNRTTGDETGLVIRPITVNRSCSTLLYLGDVQNIPQDEVNDRNVGLAPSEMSLTVPLVSLLAEGQSWARRPRGK